MMPLLRKPFGREKENVPTVETDQYIDLGALHFDDEALGASKGLIKIAEILRFEDLSPVTQEIYNGNVVLIDYSYMANDTMTLKRISNELKAVARDTNGDVAAIGNNIIIVTPNGMKVDRNKIKGGFH